MKIEDLQKQLGQDAELYDWQENEAYIWAKLKKRVSPSMFKELAAVMRDSGGEYVKWNPIEKKGAYFKFSKYNDQQNVTQKVVSTATPQTILHGKAGLMKEAVELLNRLKQILEELQK